MEDLTYNNKDSKYYGQNFMLYSPEDVWGVDKDGKPVITTPKGAFQLRYPQVQERMLLPQKNFHRKRK